MRPLHWRWLSAVRDSTQLDSALSGTALSVTQRCPEQHSAWLSVARNSTQLDSALPGTALSLTQRCPGKISTWLTALPDSDQWKKMQISVKIRNTFSPWISRPCMWNWIIQIITSCLLCNMFKWLPYVNIKCMCKRCALCWFEIIWKVGKRNLL